MPAASPGGSHKVMGFSRFKGHGGQQIQAGGFITCGGRTLLTQYLNDKMHALMTLLTSSSPLHLAQCTAGPPGVP